MALLPPPILHLPATLRFLTRLPVPRFGWEPEDGPPDLDRLGSAFPLAGAVVGLIGGGVLLAASTVLPPLLAATLAVGALAVVTGALHEDGLADTADGLGGMDREHRLAIMRDSRLGSFGAVALVLALMLRVGALEALTALSPLAAAGTLVAASVLARLAALALIAALPAARPEGLAGRAGRPSTATLWKAGIAALIISGLFAVYTMSWATLLTGFLVAGLAWSSLVRLAAAKFGGHTGDVAGAAALVVEIAFLIGALIFPPSIG